MRGSRDFCQSYLVLSLFYSLQRGPNGFIAEITILILYQGSRGGPLFSRGGGVSNFFQGGGVQMLISLETHVRTCYFPGGGGIRTPYPPLDPHMGNVIITGLSGIDLSGLMTDEVFQMMHWYCACLTPSRNTALGSGSFCNSAFFLPNIHYVNAVSRKISVTG